jgi:hypothetical protein
VLSRTVQLRRSAVRALTGDPDLLSMTIDLTGPAPRLVPTCDRCEQEADLFRLAGSDDVLCGECFGSVHA